VVARLRHLQFLELDSNKFTDEHLVQLGLPASVDWLAIRSSAITAEGLNCLARFDQLRTLELELGRAQLSQEDARAIARLQGLQSLVAEQHTLAEPALAELAALPHLRTCILGPVADPHGRGLQKLTRLEALTLRANINEGLLQAFSRLTHLEALRLTGDDWPQTATADWSGLERLEHVHLAVPNMNQAAIDCLATLPDLRRLDVWHCQINPEEITGQKALLQLEELRLVNSGTRNPELGYLRAFPNVTRLTIGQFAVKESMGEIARLHQLEELDLTRTDINDPALLELAPLQNLRRLRVALCAVSDAGIARLKARLPGLEVEK
jgi:hypothetical protein